MAFSSLLVRALPVPKLWTFGNTLQYSVTLCHPDLPLVCWTPITALTPSSQSLSKNVTSSHPDLWLVHWTFITALTPSSDWLSKSVTRIAKAARHKFPGKSSLYVSFFPSRPVPSCPVYSVSYLCRYRAPLAAKKASRPMPDIARYWRTSQIQDITLFGWVDLSWREL